MANEAAKKVLFYGDFDLTRDAKNRLMIPSEIRNLIDTKVHGNAFFATFRKKTPWLYLEKYYVDMFNEQMPADISPTYNQMDFVHLKLSSATRLEWDGQGRVVLPPRFLKRAGLGSDVTLIGAHDHLEIWDRQAWLTEQERLFENSPEIEASAMLARSQKQSAGSEQHVKNGSGPN
jgi:MraZ protein